MDAGDAESETQSMRDGFFQRKMPDELIPQLIEALPVNVVIGSDGLVAFSPGHVGNRSLGYHPKSFLAGHREGEIDCFLVGYVD